MNGAPATVIDVLRGDFGRRSSVPELMDDPRGDRGRLERTLTQFAGINRLFSRYRRVFDRLVGSDAADAGLKRFSVLDVGGGGGDIAQRIVRDAARRGQEAEVTILEADPRVAEFARRACARFPEITVEEGSALDLPFSTGPASSGSGVPERGVSSTPVAASSPSQRPSLRPPQRRGALNHDGGRNTERCAKRYDYVICNHLLHHFRDEQLPRLVQCMTAAARRRVVANDLRRSRASAVAFVAIATLLFPGGFTAFDGALSVNKGFRPVELRRLLDKAELQRGAKVYSLVPNRVVVEITLSGSNER